MKPGDRPRSAAAACTGSVSECLAKLRMYGRRQIPRAMERLLTPREVAQILNVSAAWVYDHADRKRPAIPSVRLGKAVRFRPEDVRMFIEEMTRRVG